MNRWEFAATKTGLDPRFKGTFVLLAYMALLVGGTVAIYSRTLSAPFVLDDDVSIAKNATIRSLWPLGSVLSPPIDSGVGGRPLLNLSYALNFACGGESVAGYHAVNLSIHVLAALSLFCLVLGTLRLPNIDGRFGDRTPELSLVISALWAWHPLQTESVTYISQRAESLMGLCYLLTLCFFLVGAHAQSRGKRIGALALSVCACLAGMATKQVMVTAPLAVLIYDSVFLSGSVAMALKRRRTYYLALGSTWILLATFLKGIDRQGVGYSVGVPWWSYGLTECRVIVRYLLLVFWPKPLVFDYGSMPLARLADSWPFLLAVAGLLSLAAGLMLKCPKAGFAALWFFLILAPTSSVVPIALQPMAESRLYLPLAGIVSITILIAFRAAPGWSLGVGYLLCLALGMMSYQRNLLYLHPYDLWEDTVAHAPSNARAHVHLGNALLLLPGRLDDAVSEYRQAARIDPKDATARNDIGDAYLHASGHLSEAIQEFEEALKINPSDAIVHNNLGLALLQTHTRTAEAVTEFQESLRLKPDLIGAHLNLGHAFSSTPGKRQEAIDQYHTVLRLQPNNAMAHFDLGNAWLSIPGGLDRAISEYQIAIRLKPDYLAAHYNLAAVLLQIPKRHKEAVSALEDVLRLDPKNNQVRRILESARASDF